MYIVRLNFFYILTHLLCSKYNFLTNKKNELFSIYYIVHLFLKFMVPTSHLFLISNLQYSICTELIQGIYKKTMKIRRGIRILILCKCYTI